MQMVAAVIGGGDGKRVRGVRDGGGEVDDAVEAVSGPDPGVDRLPRLDPRVRLDERSAERRDGAGEDAQAPGVGTGGDLLVRGDDVVGGRVEPDVVDALHEDDGA